MGKVVIYDSLYNYLELKQKLEGLDVELIRAETPAHLLQCVVEGVDYVMLSDSCCMPKVVQQNLRVLGVPQPKIICTSYQCTLNKVTEWIKEGVNHILLKPFNNDALFNIFSPNI